MSTDDRSVSVDIGYPGMVRPMMEMLVTKLNLDLSEAHYRPYYTEMTTTNDVECTIKIMLGNMTPQGIGSGGFDHTGWIYFDFGSNDERAAELISDSVDELLCWIDYNYVPGVGYTYAGTTIRNLTQIPYQGYSQPRETFLHDMVMFEFEWERD